MKTENAVTFTMQTSTGRSRNELHRQHSIMPGTSEILVAQAHAEFVLQKVQIFLNSLLLGAA